MGDGHVARSTLGYCVAHRGSERPRGAQRQSCRTTASSRAPVPLSAPRPGVGPLREAGRVCARGRRPAS
eukprot:8559962-Alexandrium_andersonii.AAC.1